MMRKLAAKIFLFIFVFVSIAAVYIPSSAEGDEPGFIVNFATKTGLNEWQLASEQSDGPVHGMKDSVEWKLNSADHCTRFISKHPIENGGDGDARMTAELSFSSKEYPYIVFVYRMSGTKSQNHIYIKDDKANPEYSASEGTWLSSVMKTNGKWQTVLLDIKKDFPAISGNIKGIRIPVACDMFGYFDIQYIAAFSTSEAALAFDFEDYLSKLPPEPTEEPYVPKTEEPQITAVPSAPSPEQPAAGVNPLIYIIAAAVLAVLLTAVIVLILIIVRKKEDQ